jgi:MoxR-like ATPase
MWLQNIADVSVVSDKCWELFKLLLQKQWDPDKINALIKGIIDTQIGSIPNGLGINAVKNLLYFIRPDLTFSYEKSKGLEIKEEPGYWSEAPHYYLQGIWKKEFAVFPTSCGGKEYFLQYGKSSVEGVDLHYEIVCGGQRQDVAYKIFTEYHVEPKAKAKGSHFLQELKKALNDCQGVEILPWYRPGCAVRYGEGVSVLDFNTGRGRNFAEVRNELEQAMRGLVEAVDCRVKHFFSELDQDSMIAEKRSLLESSKQLILTGAPGTGKTFTAKQLAKKWIAETNGSFSENFCQVQFHPGYDYSDFIIGLKPEVVNGKVTFKWKDGLFKSFADKAKKARQTDGKNCKPYIFLIDEINRADLSRVFGEVFSLLEEDYRYPENETGIILPDGSSFVLPDNLYIIATMNDIDRSVESMDFALRRRFSFLEVKAEDSVCIIEENTKISDENKAKLKNVMAELNKYIGSKNELLDNRYHLDLGDEYALGGAYFVHFAKYADEELPQEMLWDNHLHIILNEYLRGHRDRHAILTCLKNVFDSAWNGSWQ